MLGRRSRARLNLARYCWYFSCFHKALICVGTKFLAILIIILGYFLHRASDISRLKKALSVKTVMLKKLALVNVIYDL